MDEPEPFSEAGRYQITDIGGKGVLVDSMTGKTWVLRNLESGKPVLVLVSMTTHAKEDKP